VDAPVSGVDGAGPPEPLEPVEASVCGEEAEGDSGSLEGVGSEGVVDGASGAPLDGASSEVAGDTSVEVPS
jgi:hypothetical protein